LSSLPAIGTSPRGGRDDCGAAGGAGSWARNDPAELATLIALVDAGAVRVEVKVRPFTGKTVLVP
jgi:hypothetical protein